MTLAVVIAKGQSSRLPRKNLIDVCGLPLTAWSIIQARCSRLIDRVVLSTDDDELATLGEAHGAEIVRRPDWINGDHTAYVPVKHAIETVDARHGWPDSFLCVLPTSPLRFPWDMDCAIEVLGPEGHVQPVSYQRELHAYRWVAPRRAYLELQSTRWKLADQAGGFTVWNTRHWLAMSAGQPLTETQYQSAVYGGRKDAHMPLWHNDPERVVYPMRPWQRADVDDAEDLEEVRLLMQHHIMSRGGVGWYEAYAAGNVEAERWMPTAS